MTFFRKFKYLKYRKILFYLLCMGVKLSVSHKREEYKLIVCEKCLLRRILDPKQRKFRRLEKFTQWKFCNVYISCIFWVKDCGKNSLIGHVEYIEQGRKDTHFDWKTFRKN
jgi:hypothetical protein